MRTLCPILPRTRILGVLHDAVKTHFIIRWLSKKYTPSQTLNAKSSTGQATMASRGGMIISGRTCRAISSATKENWSLPLLNLIKMEERKSCDLRIDARTVAFQKPGICSIFRKRWWPHWREWRHTQQPMHPDASCLQSEISSSTRSPLMMGCRV